MALSTAALAVRVAAKAKAAEKASIPEACSLSEAAKLLGVQRGTVGDVVARLALPTTALKYSSLGRQLERAEIALIRFLLTPKADKARVAAKAEVAMDAD